MTASSSPGENILRDGIKITANCSRHVLFTAAREERWKKKSFWLDLWPPPSASASIRLLEVSWAASFVLSSAQTSLEGGRIWGEKAPAATEYYAIYWVSSYGDKVDFNLGVCGGKSCWTRHIFIEKSQQIIGVKVTQSNFPSSNFFPHSFYPTFIACTGTNLFIQNFLVGEGRKIWTLLHLIFGWNFIAEVNYHEWVTEFLGQFLLD